MDLHPRTRLKEHAMSEVTDTSAIVKGEGRALTPPQRAMLSREVLTVEAEQRALLGAYVKQQMVEGTDYGKIPGTNTPTLLKPGAEKLLGLFHCSPEYELVRDQCTQDFEGGFFKYTFRVSIRGPGGALLAEGYGSANSRESRYRWRDARRKCPSCNHAEALLKSKKEPGFFCWDKKGGCGATFGPDDKRITEQVVGKVENPDIADLDNTILKMAKKRALVDASIALARCSDMFTQDLEDRSDDDERRDPPEAHTPPAKHAEVTHFQARPPEQSSSANKPKKPPLNPADTVIFGPYGGKPIASLDNDGLQESIHLASEKLKGSPEGDWVPRVRANLAALNAEAELRFRARPSALAPISPAKDEDDVPF